MKVQKLKGMINTFARFFIQSVDNHTPGFLKFDSHLSHIMHTVSQTRSLI